jgi:formate dehydrogenase subunit gamma
MQWIPEYKDDVPRVERFNFLSRFTHWGHTVTFLLCLFTGLALFLNNVDWLALADINKRWVPRRG